MNQFTYLQNYFQLLQPQQLPLYYLFNYQCQLPFTTPQQSVMSAYQNNAYNSNENIQPSVTISSKPSSVCNDTIETTKTTSKSRIKSIIKRFSRKEILSQLQLLLSQLTQCENNNQMMEINLDLQILNEIDKEFTKKISQKFFMQKKTKEELIKFIFRKCFKFLKQKLINSQDYDQNKDLEEQFFENYFSQTISKKEFIPFKIDSQNKTMNSVYIRSLFQSRKFVEGYIEFLQQFEIIWKKENEEKVDNMKNQVFKYIISGNLETIYSYNRFPWNQQAKMKCKSIALSLKKEYIDQNEFNI